MQRFVDEGSDAEKGEEEEEEEDDEDEWEDIDDDEEEEDVDNEQEADVDEEEEDVDEEEEEEEDDDDHDEDEEEEDDDDYDEDEEEDSDDSDDDDYEEEDDSDVPSEAHKIRLEGNALFKSAVAQMHSVNPFQFKLLIDKAINRYSDAIKVATTAKDLSSLEKNLGVSHHKIAERFLAVSGFSEDVVVHVKKSLQFFDAARARARGVRKCQKFDWRFDIESRVDEGAKLLWSSAREVRWHANYESTKGLFLIF
jgi:hypothetical protein